MSLAVHPAGRQGWALLHPTQSAEEEVWGGAFLPRGQGGTGALYPSHLLPHDREWLHTPP